MAPSDLQKKILIGIATSPFSDWKKKIEQLDEYDIKEIAFFPTFLDVNQRKEAYALLKKTRLERIPHVHIRHDMEEWEMKFFKENYATFCFNTHPDHVCLDLVRGFEKFSDMLFIENLYVAQSNLLFTPEIIKDYNFAGICLDFTHLARENIINKPEFDRKTAILEKFKIGCNHIGAIAEKPRIERIDNEIKYDQHTYLELNEFDYLKRYPKRYFSNYISLELENALTELIEAKKYIEELIRSKENE